MTGPWSTCAPYFSATTAIRAISAAQAAKIYAYSNGTPRTSPGTLNSARMGKLNSTSPSMHNAIMRWPRPSISPIPPSPCSAAVREPPRVVDAHHPLRYVVVKLPGRAHLFLAAAGAFVERHFDLDLERRQLLVFQLVRERLPALGFRSELLAA